MTGITVTADDRPLAAVQITLVDPEDVVLAQTRSADDGTFQLPGRQMNWPDTVTLQAEQVGFQTLSRRLGNDRFLQLALIPITVTFVATGQVLGPDKRSVQNCRIMVEHLGRWAFDGSEQVLPAPERVEDLGFHEHERGQFSVAFQAQPGEDQALRLRVTADGFAAGGSSVLRVDAGQAHGLTVRLGALMTGLVGTVTDEFGKPLEHVSVWLTQDIGAISAAVSSDSQGQFQLPVSAATLKTAGQSLTSVAAVKDGFSTLKKDLPAPVDPIVEGQAWPNVVLALNQGSAIRGRALDAGGGPLAGASVVVFDRSVESPSWSFRRQGTTASAAGEFEFAEVPTSRMSLAIIEHEAGAAPAWYDVQDQQIQADHTGQVELRLPGSITLKGNPRFAPLGELVMSVEVRTVGATDGRLLARTITQAGGFMLRHLPRGQVQLRVFIGGGLHADLALLLDQDVMDLGTIEITPEDLMED